MAVWPARIAAARPLAARLASRLLGDAQLAAFEADGFVTLQMPLDALAGATLSREAREMREYDEYFDQPFKAMLKRGTRSDEICFASAEDLRPRFPTLASALDVLGCLASELNARLRTADAGTLLAPEGCQFACYSQGARYKAHRDTYVNADGSRVNEREVTLICYLNDGWDVAADGGALRIYPDAPRDADEDEREGGRRGRHVDVTPALGHIVVFRSRLLHEVMPNTSAGKRRCAMTMWTCNMV